MGFQWETDLWGGGGIADVMNLKKSNPSRRWPAPRDLMAPPGTGRPHTAKWRPTQHNETSLSLI
jgi:hypothetical protein